MTRERMFWLDFPSTVLLDQGQPVWCIAIDLIRAAKDERCIGTMVTCFKQRECAVSVDGEVRERLTRAQSCDGCARMDYHGNVAAIFAEYFLDCGLIANV